MATKVQPDERDPRLVYRHPDTYANGKKDVIPSIVPSPSERDRCIERAAERRAMGFADGLEARAERAEAALSEVLDERERLREALAEAGAVLAALLLADVQFERSAHAPDVKAAMVRAETQARAALSPGGGAERPEEET
jgi:hypothetical protein